MGAGGGHAHEHGASAVDVDGELVRTSRGLGLVLLILGGLLASGGIYLLTRSSPVERVEPAGQGELDGQ